MTKLVTSLAGKYHRRSIMFFFLVLTRWWGVGSVRPVRIDGSPRASGIYDSIMAARAHGIHVPPELASERVTSVLVRGLPFFPFMLSF
jgi:hypothetical protein